MSDLIKIESILHSKILLYCAIFLLILKISISTVFINFPQNIFFADITKTSLVNILNQTRGYYGLQPLVENQRLDQAAKMKAEDMIQKQYFSHTSPQGVTPWYWFAESGYDYKYAGENLAIGFYDSNEAFSAWINSPSHRSNILNQNYNEVGTAVLAGYGPNNAIIVVQLFGSEILKPVPMAKETANTDIVAVQKEEAQEVNKEEQNSAQGATVDSKADSGEKVLSGAIENLSLSSEIENTGKNDFYSRFLNFVIYNYGAFVQNVIYGFLMITVGLLISAIFFTTEPEARKGLIIRAVILVAILSSAALFNKEIIISIIPHRIII